MKIYTVLLVCTAYGQVVQSQRVKDTRQNQESLTDMRWVSLKKTNLQSLENLANVQVVNPQRQIHTPSGDTRLTQVQPVQQFDQNNREYIQKMANQLFLTQKHVPLLSEYQKYIINQDPLVRKYVFGNHELEPAQQQQQQLLQQQQQQQLQQQQQQHIGNVQYRARSLYLEQPKKIVNIDVPNKAAFPTRNFNEGSDAVGRSTAVKYVAVPPPASFYDVVSTLTPKIAFFQPVQPYPYYNPADSGDLQSQTVPSVSLTNTHLASSLDVGLQKTYPIHTTKAVKLLEDHHEHVGDSYQFVYDVKDHAKGNDFGHKEVKEDDKTYGHYYLKLPDGRFETVKYWADKTGFHANVEFKGRAVHPESHNSHHSHHDYDIQLL